MRYKKSALTMAFLVIGFPSTAPALAKENKKMHSDKIARADFIPAYVSPYYSGPKSSGAAPESVSVGTAYDAKLSSTKREDILSVRDMIKADNGMVSPMTLFVLSARLYDVGQRDEAVFWFYAAKDRWRITHVVGDNQALAQALQACSAFSNLVGGFINGYAFCDIDKQIKALKNAAQWTAENPYKALLLPQIASPHKDREAAMKAAASERINQASESEAHFKDPKIRAEFIQKRKEAGLDKKFCF